jgi:KDO2-lipid IV(A) lauroyltransferase
VRREVRFRLETAAVTLLPGLARALPRRVLLGLGGIAGLVAFRMLEDRREVTLENLRLALGESRSAVERDRIARACWRNLGRHIVDTLTFPRFGRHSIGSLVTYDGLEHVRAAYARGRGVLIFSGHFGHWELTAMMQGHLGLPLVLLTRKLDNTRLDAALGRLRCCSGNRVVYKHRSLRGLLRALRRGDGVAIVIDQDARDDGVFVPFFGRPASTTASLARLALRTGAAVIPTFSVPGDGRHHIVYEPPLELPTTDDPEADTLRITAECTAIIEKWVRRHPENWLWMHRRWKTPAASPRSEASPPTVARASSAEGP